MYSISTPLVVKYNIIQPYVNSIYEIVYSRMVMRGETGCTRALMYRKPERQYLTTNHKHRHRIEDGIILYLYACVGFIYRLKIFLGNSKI